jgi:ornithine carbamoyltransferase
VDHFTNFKKLKPDYLQGIISKALDIKKDPVKYAKSLVGKKMYMLFQKTSTRTALSFAFGMKDLGGEYFSQNWEDSNFAVGEIPDEIRYVSRNVDVVVARLKTNADISTMAKYSSVPVINGCCDMYHPCQAIADLVTIQEIFGRLKVMLLYIGVRNNVLNSLMDSLPRLGGELYAVTPIINEPSVDDELYAAALKTGNFYDIGSGDPTVKALHNLVGKVDVVYVDTWIDMEFINNQKFAKLKEERVKTMLPFQVNNELLQGTRAIVMHDMPIHAGYEISRDIVEKNIDTILQQAENRKYAQQAILLALLGPRIS